MDISSFLLQLSDSQPQEDNLIVEVVAFSEQTEEQNEGLDFEDFLRSRDCSSISCRRNPE
jgi:hypothetical protein